VLDVLVGRVVTLLHKRDGVLADRLVERLVPAISGSIARRPTPSARTECTAAVHTVPRRQREEGTDAVEYAVHRIAPRRQRAVLT
jgi:hypothetical protein